MQEQDMNLKQETEQVEAETSETQAGQETAEETKIEVEVVDERDEQIADLNNRLARLQADFTNFRRRTQSEKEQLSTFVTANVVEKFLKVLDNFERAQAVSAKANDVESVVAGMEKIHRQFLDVLKSLDVEEIAAQGEQFDPNMHEAVMRAQNPDVQDNTIDLVLEKGYKLSGKVIRTCKVRVISND
ncbi:MAG: nucleotide exchange factor GrpE [Phascolarctobacterium sp.]|nr:nucleotide exchange factor GrpE [Phascolarctobacterium sp.]